MRQVRAALAHTAPDREPLKTVPGQWVQVGARDEEWPAFILVTTFRGSGWVPARCLSEPIGRRAVVTSAYDTTELPTETGELLEVIEEDLESGWVWCRSAAGREGWVPVRTLEWVSPPPLPQPPPPPLLPSPPG